MEIAALVCNNKLDYESTLQTYSIFEYAKRRGNQIQIIDYNFLDDKLKFGYIKKKNNMLYNFLNNSVILTSMRYKTMDQVEENPPLADKYVIVNGEYSDLHRNIVDKNLYAYGVKDINEEQIQKIKDNYADISTLFDIKVEDVKRVADPLFLLSKEDWYDFSLKSSMSLEKENYVLLYSNFVTQDMLKYAKNLSDINNIKVYILADKVQTIFHKGKRINNAKPFDLVNLVSNAQEIITSCDDGIKLAIMFEKSLHIFADNSNDYQMEIINEFNLVDRIVNSIDRVITKPLNYNESLNKVEELKGNVIDFI